MKRVKPRLRMVNGVWSCAGAGCTRYGITYMQAHNRWVRATTPRTEPCIRRAVSDPLDRVPVRVLHAIAANAANAKPAPPPCPAYPESLVQRVSGTDAGKRRTASPEMERQRRALEINQARASAVQPRVPGILGKGGAIGR